MEKKKHKKDFYARKAKKDGYQSRAAYKIKQINDKFRIFRKGIIVLDLCGSPGGWSQIAKLEVGPQGAVVTDVEITWGEYTGEYETFSRLN